MRDLITIFKRELSTYFNSVIGYIFLIVFISLNCGLFVTGFFQFPMADMRSFFSILPFILCVFVPAVTMRLWAEERAENTIELLLTFPMRPTSIVLGKFLASFVFLIIGLAGTLIIPLMLMVLGQPDLGQIASSYLGAILLGAFFLSLGQCISGFSRDQIVAFVLSLLACFGLYLLGTDFIASTLDSWITGLGTILKNLLGVTEHYSIFTKGVFEVADLLYFLIWIFLFLFLNGMFIEGRGRKSAGLIFSTSVLFCMGIGLVFNALVADSSLGRFDWTQGQIYTVSQGSKNILAQLKIPVQVKYYVTPSQDMPTEMKTLSRDVQDKLQELRIASKGMIDFSIVHMHAANVLQGSPLEQKSAENNDPMEKRMLEKGIEPFSVQAMRQTGAVSNLVYSSIGVAYKDKDEEIIPRIIPASLNDLEYQLVSTVFRLTRDKKPTIAIVSSRPFNLLKRWLEQEKYNVVEAKLTKDSPLPDNADLLFVLDPQNFNPRQRFELGRALSKGHKMIMAVQNCRWDYNIMRGQLGINRMPVNPEVNQLLENYGIEVDDQILMDTQSTGIRVARNQLEQMFGGGLELKLPMQIMISRETMNISAPIMARLSNIFYMWGSALKLNNAKLEKNSLQTEILASSSPDSWLIAPKMNLSQADIEPPATGKKKYPIFVSVSGQFPDPFAGQDIPLWPGDEGQNATKALPVAPAPGKLLLIGGAELFSDDLLPTNLDLALNSVDSLVYGNDLIQVRGNKEVNRMIVDISPAQAMAWKLISYLLVSLVIAFAGLSRVILRRRRRTSYALGQ